MTLALRRTVLSLSAAGMAAAAFIGTTFAAFGGEMPNIPNTPGATSADGIRNIIIKIITAVLNFLALVAVIIVIIAGIRLIVSQGEEEQKEKAKKTIFYALAGLAVVLFARVIVGIITSYLATEVGGS